MELHPWKLIMPSRWFWPVALFLAGWLILSSPWFFEGLTIPYDAKAHFQAQLSFLSDSIHRGQSPFWTPFVFAGSPQIADPQSLIFSPALLLAVFIREPSFFVLDAYVLSLLAMGGVAIILYVLDKGWHPASALIAGFVFAFGGSAAWRIQHIGQIQSYCFFAVSLFFLSRCLHRQSVPYGIVAGISFALMIITPDQVAFLAALFLIVYVGDFWVQSSILKGFKKEVKTTAIPLISFVLTALVISLIPIMLTVLFVSESNRPEIIYSDAILGSLHPANILTIFSADVFGAVNSSTPYWGPSSSEWSAKTTLAENMAQIYFGALPAILIIFLFINKKAILDKRIRIFVISLVFYLFYALGHYTPLFELVFHYLPGVSGFRRPADATFMMGAIISILSAYSLESTFNINKEDAESESIDAILQILSIIFAIAICIAIYRSHLRDVLNPIFLSAIWLSGALVLISLLNYIRERYVLTTILITIFSVVDLYANNGPNQSTAEQPFVYEILSEKCKNPTLRILKDKMNIASHGVFKPRVELVGLGFNWPNVSLVQKMEGVFGYNPLRLAEFQAVTGAPDALAVPEDRKFTPLFPSYKSIFSDLLGLQFIVSSVPIEKIDKTMNPGDLSLIAVTNDAMIYENKSALPRAMFVESAVFGNFDDMIKSGDWPDRFDPSRELILDVNQFDYVDSYAKKIGPSGDIRAQVSIDVYENTQVLLSVETNKDGYLLLNDVWHPWWHASIDGSDAQILQANVLFRALAIKAGKHKIKFEFHPIEGAITEIAEKIESRLR